MVIINNQSNSTSWSKLMIVAHPDDEALFGGQELVQSSDWLVICLTGHDNIERKTQFVSAMNSINITAQIWHYPDIPGLSKKPELASQLWHPFLPELQTKLSSFIMNDSCTQVITHNEQGEYGHAHHQITHHLVRSITPKKKLRCFSIGSQIKKEILERKLALLRFYEAQLTTHEIKKYYQWITRATTKSLE